MINKGLFHLIDDNFWKLGFKNETQAEKVILIIHVILIMPIKLVISIICIILVISIIRIILVISIMSQVRVESGLADHVWQDKRAKIASTIDQSGDNFKPELRAAW